MLLNLSRTDKTPEIKLDQSELFIEGVSVPENSVKFYDDILTMVNSLLAKKPPVFTVNFHMIYFNTSTSGIFYKLLKALELYNNHEGCKGKVIWKYDVEDEDMLEMGQDFALVVPYLEFAYSPVSGN